MERCFRFPTLLTIDDVLGRMGKSSWFNLSTTLNTVLYN